jgi:hypothetical protein
MKLNRFSIAKFLRLFKGGVIENLICFDMRGERGQKRPKTFRRLLWTVPRIKLKVGNVAQQTFFPRLKVSKFQKQILLFSFEPKKERNYFLISTLASIMSQIKKIIMRYYNRGIIFLIWSILDPYSRYQKINFVRFLVQMRTITFAFKIYWPLNSYRMWSKNPFSPWTLNL